MTRGYTHEHENKKVYSYQTKGWKMCTKALKKYLNDPLYKNSFFIMLTSISNAGFGFIFWMLAVKQLSQGDEKFYNYKQH